MLLGYLMLHGTLAALVTGDAPKKKARPQSSSDEEEDNEDSSNGGEVDSSDDVDSSAGNILNASPVPPAT